MKTREELLNEMDKFRRTLTSGQSKVLKSGLHQILNAPTEEQLKCEFCNPHINLLPPEGTGLISSENKDIGLKYCPHCGRKLGDELVSD